MRSELFIGETRLLHGPWQAFERDVARLLLHLGFQDVRLVGRAGDQGGDVLAVRDDELWVIQCKHSYGAPPVSAVAEVVHAAEYYSANRLAVALSRPKTEAIVTEIARHKRLGIAVDVIDSPRILNLVRRAPEYTHLRRDLRGYQEDASTRLRTALTDTGRGQIVMATGLGKTVVMAETVADLLRDGLLPNGRVLVTADKKEIVRQLNQAFWYQLPTWVPTHLLTGSEKPSFWEGITFATIQSVQSNLDWLPHFDLILVDEAHHVGAPTFIEVIDTLQPPMLAGATATPWRGDGYDIDSILGPPQVKLGIAEGLANGFLAEVDYRLLADNIDWRLLQDESSHHYSLGQLNTRLIVPKRDEEAARLICECFRGEHRRAALVFSPSIEHAEYFAKVLGSFGLKAQSVSSEMLDRDRDRIMSKFRRGDLDVLTSVDVFNEGVDVPDVDMIAFMRVTHSRRIFVQQLGRGLRTAPGKDQLIVLDFVTDLRRIAEVVDLDRAVRTGDIEKVGLGAHLVEFANEAAGDFMREWMLDQASLAEREADATLELPQFDFPEPLSPGGIQ
ncbi:MAG: DEAD/DEAH box helicase family protein [Armatimonadetes bacterium]|nr:DEAD/DEAH box helicase family protein [Armatimonadota bacterium]